MDSAFDDEIREFLIESNEGLQLLDQQIVQLEKDPQNHDLISSVFRTIHSIKGTCGFFGFDILGSVTHITESILVQLRERKRLLTPELITLVLEAVDAVKLILQRIETTGAEGEDEAEELRGRLEAAYRDCGSATTISGMMQEIEQNSGPADPPAVSNGAAAPAAVSVPAESGTQVPASSVVVAVEAAPVAAAVAEAPKSAEPPQAIDVARPAAAKSVKKPSSSEGVEAATGDGALTDSTIRVDVNLLNQLMNLVGELVLTRNQLLQSAGNFSSGVQQTSQRLNIITTELQESVMKTRMQPIGVVWSKLPRVVRDLSSKCGKQIQLEMQGAETELDKSLIEAIRDPLTHIVRNSCDHGIESPAERIAKGKQASGTLMLRAFHEAGAVNIEITDDGAGINPERVKAKAVEKHLITPEQAAALSASEAINLIFLPGFSTAAQVTSISGRGVGMDVVKTNIERISGSVDVMCPPEGGTSLRIKIPLTLAIIPGLIVASDKQGADGPGDCQEERFVIPQSHLVEMTRVDLSSGTQLVDNVNGALIFRHRGHLLSLVHLSSLLHRTTFPAREGFINIIILQVQGKQFGLVVDRICDTQEIVVKPLGKQLKQLACYGGATIMGDGRPALILDVGGIAKLAGLEGQHKDNLPHQQAVQSRKITSEFILFRTRTGQRMALPLAIVNRLEELPATCVEHAAGHAVVRYRGELLPLLRVSDEGPAKHLPAEGNVRVIVISNGQQPFGLLVDEIVDIVEESLEIVRTSSNPALLGSAVIGGLVTDIVDVAWLYQGYPKSWSRSANDTGYARKVAFHSPWPLGREMMRTLLATAGYLPAHIASPAELKDTLLKGDVDLLLVDDTTGNAVPEWLLQARGDKGPLANLPTVVLNDAQVSATLADKEDAERWLHVDHRDRTAVLRGIHSMLPAVKGKAA